MTPPCDCGAPVTDTASDAAGLRAMRAQDGDDPALWGKDRECDCGARPSYAGLVRLLIEARQYVSDAGSDEDHETVANSDRLLEAIDNATRDGAATAGKWAGVHTAGCASLKGAIS